MALPPKDLYKCKNLKRLMNSSFVSNADKETRISVLFLANIFKILIDGVLCIFVIINNYLIFIIIIF